MNNDHPRSTKINQDQLRSTKIHQDQPRITKINQDYFMMVLPVYFAFPYLISNLLPSHGHGLLFKTANMFCFAYFHSQFWGFLIQSRGPRIPAFPMCERC